MKKTLWMLVTMLLCSGTVWAGSPGVTFLLRNGQKVSFAFAEKPVVAVSNTDLMVSVTGSERVRFAYAEVQRVFFSDDVTSGIASVQSKLSSQPNAVFSWQNGALQVSGLMPNEQVRVYGLDGNLALSERAQIDGSLQLSFSALSKGVYVVRTQSGLSYKFFNK